MLLTIAYIVYTAIRRRQISNYKAAICEAFKEYQNSCSITFAPVPSLHGGGVLINVTERKKQGLEKDSLTSLNYTHERFDQIASMFDSAIELCAIHPQQEINISSWLDYKEETSLFPLMKLGGYQISSASDDLIYVLIETDLQTYHKDTLEHCIKIEDYGLIRAWSINENLNLLLEADIDHITSFVAMFIQGRVHINNCLVIKCIQTVKIKGKPCIYDKKLKSPLRSRENVIAFSNAAQEAAKLKKPIAVDRFPDLFVYPQNDPNGLKKESISKDEHQEKIDQSSFAIPEAKIQEMLDKGSIAVRDKEIEETVDQVLTFTITPVNANRRQDASTRRRAPLEFYREERDNIIIKPPNVLVYADTMHAGKNVKAILNKILDPERYTIYDLSKSEAPRNTWLDQVALVVICGNVDVRKIADRFIEYIIYGGKVLALCSNMLRILLPSFRTAEMRENELVYFSYGKWKRVRMMHDIFCYQASPKRNRFSEDQEDARPLPKLPQSTSFEDDQGNSHFFDVKILGEEETWQNPSILLATLPISGGKIVFSQIHLEADPAEYEDKEDLFETLKKSNAARLEIISDLLSTHLEMEMNHAAKASTVYTLAYLLSKTENKHLKTELLQNLENLTQDNTLQMPDLKVQFYTSEEITPETASEGFLPIIMHNISHNLPSLIYYKVYPINFAPGIYYKSLTTKKLGQLFIYSDVLKSTMNVMECRMAHGLAVISRQQTQGQGRCSNIWLSPIGCAMFTLQVHISTNSILGKQISLLQHIVAVAIVSAIRSIPLYTNIDIRIKWPNDIYVGTSTKIGGLIVYTRLEGSTYVCNIGAGINISNSKPTTCINDVISRYNERYGLNLEKFTCERYLALVFNQLEILLDKVEENNIQHFYHLYYKYWLHQNTSVSVVEPNGDYQVATILGIDNFGFLRVRTHLPGIRANMTVHPDRNSFDLLKGLILPIPLE